MLVIPSGLDALSLENIISSAYSEPSGTLLGSYFAKTPFIFDGSKTAIPVAPSVMSVS